MEPSTSKTDSLREEGRSPASTASSKEHIRGSSLLLVGRLIGVLVNFSIQVVMVRYLEKADYGAFAYASAAMMIISHIVALGLDKGLSRFVPIYQERGQYDKMAGTIILVICSMVVFGAALAALVAGLAGVIGGHLTPDPLALSLLIVYVWAAPLEALDDVTVKLFAIFASPRAVFFRRHILTPSLRLAAILALVCFGGDVVFLAVAYVVTSALGVTISLAIIAQLLQGKRLLHYFRHKHFEIPAREVFRFSLPLLSSDLVTALRGTLVVFFLGVSHGSVAVAGFRAVLSVARLNSIVFDSFKLLFEPMAARMYARDDRAGINELYWRTASWIVVFTFPIFAVSFVFAQPLTVLLFGDRYADSGMVLAVLSIGYFLNAVFGYNTLTLRVFHKVRALVAIDLTVVLLALLFNVLLVPQFGALGGAMASCGVFVALNIAYQIVLVRVGAVELFNARFLKAFGAVLGVISGLFAMQEVLSPPLYINFLMAVVTSLLVLWLTGPILAVEATFPELGHFRLMRWVLRIRRIPVASSQISEPLASVPESHADNSDKPNI